VGFDIQVIVQKHARHIMTPEAHIFPYHLF